MNRAQKKDPSECCDLHTRICKHVLQTVMQCSEMLQHSKVFLATKFFSTFWEIELKEDSSCNNFLSYWAILEVNFVLALKYLQKEKEKNAGNHLHESKIF